MLQVWIVVTLVFSTVELLPGNAVTAVLGRSTTPQARAELIRQLKLDRPALERYVDWITGLASGDLGQSLTARRPVTEVIGGRLRNSFQLATVVALFLLPLALGIGVLTGVKAGRRTDRIVSSATLALIATPEFVLGTLLAYVLGVRLRLFPPVALFSPQDSPLGRPSVLVLPAATLLLVSFGYAARMVRAGVAEAMRAEYVKMARVNGIPEGRVIWRYALRNALAPSIQMLALLAQYLMSGVVIVETVFQYPGIGQLLVQSAFTRDIILVQSLAVVIAAINIGMSMLADLAIIMVTPRLRATL